MSRKVAVVLLSFALALTLFGVSAQPTGAAISLTMWHMEQPPHRVKRVQELLDEWNAANPEIQIRQEVQNWGEIYTKAPLAAKAGGLPDILFGIPDFTTVLLEIGRAHV